MVVNWLIVPTLQYANNMPRAPPTRDNSTVSVSNSRMTCPRLAPRAARIAISFCLPDALARSRLATLPQAMSNTKLTAPSKISSVGLISPVICSRIATTVTPQSFL